MRSESRESRLIAAFVAVADTGTADHTAVELLHSVVEVCANTLDIESVGLVLADSDGNLELVSSTNESTDLVERVQLASADGPCVECFGTATAVSVPDLAASSPLWPAFREAAVSRGFRSAHSTPMRAHGAVFGTIDLFDVAQGKLSTADADIAQALADVATISIMQLRDSAHSHRVVEQLQKALDSRVLIEQAKGVVAHASSITTEEAFFVLRRYARNHNLTLRYVAEAVTARRIGIRSLVEERQ